jgi:tripartite-type tricarboxylate transporter receptor subunit TctC
LKVAARTIKLFSILAISIGPANDLRAAAPYYEGKTIRIIVGTSPGGGYDTYTRLIARHLANHIPGGPSIIVDNMPGAGGTLSANYMFKVAKPDGLTIGHFVGGQFLQQLLGRPGVDFDALGFGYIGVPAQDNFVVSLANTSGVTTMEQWLAAKAPVKLGAIAPGDGTYDTAKILEATLNVPLQLVSGYKGTAPIRLAVNGGEVAGLSNSWQSIKSTWRKELENNEISLIVQLGPKAHADIARVPLAASYAKTDEARKLIAAVAQAHGAAVRPYLVPPGTRKETIDILRRAFNETMKDPELLAEAAKANLEFNPSTGEELEKNVRELLKLDPPLVNKLKEILK